MVCTKPDVIEEVSKQWLFKELWVEYYWKPWRISDGKFGGKTIDSLQLHHQIH